MQSYNQLTTTIGRSTEHHGSYPIFEADHQPQPPPYSSAIDEVQPLVVPDVAEHQSSPAHEQHSTSVTHKAHAPYGFHPLQVFLYKHYWLVQEAAPKANDVHPVFEGDIGVFSEFCVRVPYISYTWRLHDHAREHAAAGPCWTRLVLKHFPLELAEGRSTVISSILLACLDRFIPVSVEDLRFDATGRFVDSLVFLWVPSADVPSVLALSGHVLCDRSSFLLEPLTSQATLLQEYGNYIRRRLSQERRHQLTEGLPSRPLDIQVSVNQQGAEVKW